MSRSRADTVSQSGNSVIEQRRQRAEKRAYKERQAGPVSAHLRHSSLTDRGHARLLTVALRRSSLKAERSDGVGTNALVQGSLRDLSPTDRVRELLQGNVPHGGLRRCAGNRAHRRRRRPCSTPREDNVRRTHLSLTAWSLSQCARPCRRNTPSRHLHAPIDPSRHVGLGG